LTAAPASSRRCTHLVRGVGLGLGFGPNPNPDPNPNHVEQALHARRVALTLTLTLTLTPTLTLTLSLTLTLTLTLTQTLTLTPTLNPTLTACTPRGRSALRASAERRRRHAPCWRRGPGRAASQCRRPRHAYRQHAAQCYQTRSPMQRRSCPPPAAPAAQRRCRR